MGIDWSKYTGVRKVEVTRRPMEEIVREQQAKHLATMTGRRAAPFNFARLPPSVVPLVSKSKDQKSILGTSAEPTYTASLGPTKVLIANSEATCAWAATYVWADEKKIDISLPMIGSVVRIFNAGHDLKGNSLWKRDATVDALYGSDKDFRAVLDNDRTYVQVFHDWWMRTVFPVVPIIRIMPAEGMPVRFTPFKGSEDTFVGTVGKFSDELGMYDLKRDCESSVKYNFEPNVWMQEVWPHTERF